MSATESGNSGFLENVKQRAVDTLMMPVRTIATPVKGVMDGTVGAVNRTLQGTIFNDKSTSSATNAPLATIANTGTQIPIRLARAGEKFIENVKTLHPIRAITQPLAELGAGVVDVATGAVDTVRNTVNFVGNAVNRVVRGTGRAATGVVTLGEDIASEPYKTTPVKHEMEVGRQGPYPAEGEHLFGIGGADTGGH
ncbi:MAG: hypothetical protein AAB592_05260 [Patescibacteria group bacterium]